MRPTVIMANAVSADGRTTGLEVDLGLFYGLVAQLGCDAHLTGSQTMMGMAAEAGPETIDVFQPPAALAEGERSLLAVVDSRGAVRHWHALRAAPYWNDYVALVAEDTPLDYLDYLRARHIGVIQMGVGRVDLTAALETLGERYAVRRLLLDSGGTLSGAMLRLGLVDEIRLLFQPCLVGGEPATTILRGPALAEPVLLDLLSVEAVGEGALWLAYRVVR